MIATHRPSAPPPRRCLPPPFAALLAALLLLLQLPTTGAVGPNASPLTPRPVPSPSTITNVAGLLALARASPIPEVSLRLDVVCLYADVAWGSVWLSDPTGTLWTGTRGCPPWLQVGDRLRISGRNLPHSTEVDWSNATVRHVATQPLPDPHRLSEADLAQPHRGDLWAELEGIARHVHYQNQHASIELIVGQRLVEVTIPKVNSSDLARENSEIRCRGILVPADRYSAPDCQHKLFCPQPRWVETLHSDLNRRFDVPVLESKVLPGAQPNPRVRLQGRVTRHERGLVELADTPLGTCLVESLLRTRLLPGLEVEAVGSFDPTPTGIPRLTHALYRLRRTSVSETAQPTTSPAAAPPALLRTCAEVRAAVGASAQQGLPVALEAVVLADFTPLGWDILFVEDATGAAYVRSDTNVWNLATGDRVAVEGITETGEYGTNVRKSRVRYLGPGTSPSPRRATLGSLQLGSEDSTWVDVLGWVRHATIRDHVLHLELCDGTGKLTVYVASGDVPLGLLDSVVRIRGVAAARFDPQGQLAGVAVFCPSLDLIHIEEPALPGPFALPRSSLPALRHFVPNSPSLRRTRVTGIATAQSTPRSVFVQDHDRALLVHLSDVTRVTPGATVEAVGIPFWRGTTLELRHARIRETGTAQLPSPLALPTPALLDPIHFGLRRVVEAELLSITRFKNLIVLGLDAGIPFDAVCADTPECRSLVRLTPGCRLRLVGPVDPGDPAGEDRTSPRLVLASAADVEILRRGPVWNSRNALVFGGAVVAILLAGTAWVRSLRLQVRTRTTQLRHELTERRQAEEALRGSLREKEVLLREIHHRVKNNLQIVSSLLSLQGLKVDSPAIRDAFADTQGRVHSMALLHETLYRSSDLANLDVADYVRTLAAHLRRALPAAAQRIAFNLEIADVRLDLDRAVACGIIINELVTNSLKHAFPRQEPGCLAIRLQPTSADRVMLEVEDDGVGMPPGFDPATSGSLGLLLVSDLARQLGGSCELKPAPGTCFHLEFPLSARA